MEDYRGESNQRRRHIRQSIENLHGKMKTARNPFQQSSIADELTKLEKERLEIDNLFDDEPEETAEDEAPRDQYPYLNTIWKRYDQLLSSAGHLERDIRASLLYMQYFEDEYLGVFTSRKLRLDVKYSVERDSFYDLFDQVSRSLRHYRAEADRIQDGTYAKQYETDILKRKVEMRHAMLVEIDWFFRKLRRFSKDLLQDVAGDQFLCQNPDEELNFSSIDREKALRGKLVREAIHELFDFSSEVVTYVEIPDFQQRPL